MTVAVPPADYGGMKAVYFDAFSGVSGDMTVGALLAVGVPLAELDAQLSLLGLSGYRILAEQRLVNGIAATKFEVVLEPGDAPHHDPTSEARHHHGAHAHHGHQSQAAHSHRAYRDIRALIERSALKPTVKATALRIFAVLAEAEAKVHAMAVDEVSFHEVGAIDSIVDIVATAIGFDWLGVECCYVSPLPLGSGVVRSQHGFIPVPGPATAELLRGFDTRVGDGSGELVTPTGAAIVAALSRPGPPPPLRPISVGYGAGTRVLEDRPNLLRLIVAEHEERADYDEVEVLETNIDDLNPEIYAYVCERLFEAGARDVFLVPVQMKKGRPGCLLTVLADPERREILTAIILSETSALGVRYHRSKRTVLPRHQRPVATEFGTVTVKVATAPDGTVNLAPEYEDCRRIARERQVSLKQVYAAAVAAAQREGWSKPSS